MYEFYENKKYFLDFDVEYFSLFGSTKICIIMAHELIPNFLEYVYKSENVIKKS